MTIFYKLAKQKRVEEALKYSEKYKAYVLEDPYNLSCAFIGDTDDYLNVKLGNHQFLRDKYKLTEDYFVTSDSFKTIYPQNSICGYTLNVKETNTMPKDIYSLVTVDYGLFGFRPLKINTDEFIDFNNPDIKKFEKGLIEFFQNKEKYKKEGARHKGAALLYGLPGSGKSTIILNTIKTLSKDVYCVFISKSMSLSALNEFKAVFEGHNVIIILEEMTERLSGGTEDLLNFLDGYASWEHCYVIATTNYPEELAPNLVSRPGRFNSLIEIKAPTEDQKVTFLLKKGFSQEEIDTILPKSKDFSLDDIAQIAIQSRINGQNLDEYLKEVENTKKKVKTAFKGKLGKMGIE